MNKLTILNKQGVLLVDSREVAEMVDKEHKNLLQDIRRYIASFNQLKVQPADSEHEYIRRARAMFEKTHGSIDNAIKEFLWKASTKIVKVKQDLVTC